MTTGTALQPDALDFSDPSRWDVRADRNIFDAHEERDREGRLVRRFTRADLEEIAARCNRRDATRNYCPLTLGHTRDGEPETSQPPIVGYARHFKVAYDDALKRHVIRATFYLKREHAEEAERYPRPSVELWHQPENRFFDPISLLVRTPQRDVGVWTLARRGKVLRYEMGGDMADEPDKDRPEDKKDGDPASPPDKDAPDKPPEGEGDKGGGGGSDPSRPGPDGVDPGFHDNFMKCMSHHGYKTKYDALSGAAPGAPTPPPAVPPRPAFPSPTNGAPPTPAQPPVRMSKPNDEVLKYRREKDAAEKKFTYAMALRGIERDGAVFEFERELEDCLDMNPTQFARHLDRIRRFSKDCPAGGEMVRVSGEPAEAGQQPGVDEAALEKMAQYIRKHPGCTQADALQYARGQRGLDGQPLQAVKK